MFYIKKIYYRQIKRLKLHRTKQKKPLKIKTVNNQHQKISSAVFAKVMCARYAYILQVLTWLRWILKCLILYVLIPKVLNFQNILKITYFLRKLNEFKRHNPKWGNKVVSRYIHSESNGHWELNNVFSSWGVDRFSWEAVQTEHWTN